MKWIISFNAHQDLMVGNCYYPYFIDEEYKAKEISALPKVTQQHGSSKTAAQIKD